MPALPSTLLPSLRESLSSKSSFLLEHRPGYGRLGATGSLHRNLSWGAHHLGSLSDNLSRLRKNLHCLGDSLRLVLKHLLHALSETVREAKLHGRLCTNSLVRCDPLSLQTLVHLSVGLSVHLSLLAFHHHLLSLKLDEIGRAHV